MTLLGWFSCIFMLTGSFVKEKTNKKIITLFQPWGVWKGGGLPEKLGGSVPPTFLNPYPIKN